MGSAYGLEARLREAVTVGGKGQPLCTTLSGRRWHLHVETECSLSVTDPEWNLLVFIQHTKNLQEWELEEEAGGA